MPTDIEIARAATLIPISEVAKKAGVPDEALIPYGKYKAKIDRDLLPKAAAPGKLILVTAINPTPAGEGKTTTSVGLSRCAPPDRQENPAVPARTFAGPLLRGQGRRRRRRQEPGHADG